MESSGGKAESRVDAPAGRAARAVRGTAGRVADVGVVSLGKAAASDAVSSAGTVSGAALSDALSSRGRQAANTATTNTPIASSRIVVRIRPPKNPPVFVPGRTPPVALTDPGVPRPHPRAHASPRRIASRDQRFPVP